MKDIIIDLKITDKKHLISHFNDEVINAELSNYITNYMLGTDIKSNVIINIITKIDFTNEEKEKYTNIIRKEFSENIDELNSQIKISFVKKISSFILGTIFIIISYLIDKTDSHIISQILTIFGWVAIWEVDYSLIFVDPKRKRILKRYLQLFNSKINFQS